MKSFRQFPGLKRGFLRRDFRNEGAFTLTELLVTIGIIGVLGTILLTTLGRSKLKGHTVYSQNNLRQLSAAYIARDVEMGEFMNYKQVRRGNWVKTIREREGYRKKLFSQPGFCRQASSWPRNCPEGLVHYRTGKHLRISPLYVTFCFFAVCQEYSGDAWG